MGTSLALATPPRTGLAATDQVTVDVVVPVHNEQAALAAGVRRLRDHLDGFPFSATVTIADNASTDATWEIAQALAAELPGVRAVRFERKGRGHALRQVWADSDAQVLAYMDVDLSTDLAALLPLVAPLVSGHSDLAIGTRLARGSRVTRGPKREVISRCYNVLLRTTLRARFSDAQCGFKAITRDVADRLLPLVEDDGWFFDTELLVLAERSGLRIHEVPVDWVDDPDSRVDVLATAVADLQGIVRVGKGLLYGGLRHRLPVAEQLPLGMPRQLVRFAGIGLVSTLAYLALYLALRPTAGAQAANALALLLTAVANTSANRRLTFGVSGSQRLARQHAEGLGVFVLGLALTSGALAALHLVTSRPTRAVELVVLVAANAAATLLRFVLLRAWVFHPRRQSCLAK